LLDAEIAVFTDLRFFLPGARALVFANLRFFLPDANAFADLRFLPTRVGSLALGRLRFG
jgi:hypothetical protein